MRRAVADGHGTRDALSNRIDKVLEATFSHGPHIILFGDKDGR